LRDKIDPAHDFTFFCFFLELGFLDVDNLRDAGSSIESIGMLAVSAWLVGTESAIEVALSWNEAALEGRDRIGEDSRDNVSWPKNPHFLAGNLGLVGVVGIL
jgi:hypothetical protein